MLIHSPAVPSPARQQETKPMQQSVQSTGEQVVAFVDNRPEAASALQLLRMVDSSKQMKAGRALQAITDNSARAREIQVLQSMAARARPASALPEPKASNSGLQNQPKAGVESFSGTSTDYAEVNHHSNKPAQLDAHAIVPEVAQKNDVPIQRVSVPFKTPAAPTAEEQLVIDDANAIDALTDAAYTNTMNHLQAAVAPVPVPLAIGMFPGVRAGNFANMIERLQGGNDALKAAAVGYAIEDQVTFGGGLPGAAESQKHLGGAILDFEITHGADGARRKGVVDLTSTGQIGHVLDKDFQIGPFSLVWESVYPSIDFGALGAGAVALAPATVALVNNTKRRKANDYLSGRLYQINRQLDLYYGGIKRDDEAFRIRGERLSAFINQLPNNAPWSGIMIGATNTYIAQVNELLHPVYQLETLNHMIANAQAKYLLAGAPMW